MFDFLSNFIDIVKGKERADWVVRTWLRDHVDEYQSFVESIERITEADMTAVYDMYKVMKECMPPEAEQYYDILLRMFSGEADAFHETKILEHANEIGECAVNGKTIEINIGTGEVTITDNPRKDRLVVKASDLIDRWQYLSLYTKAYCKDCFERYKESLPKNMQSQALDSILKLIKIHYVANLVFMPGLMANLYDKVVLRNNGMLFAMYYFVTYDHGLQRMARIFSRVVSDEVPGVDGVTVFKSTIHNLTMTSLTNGWDTKETWTETAEQSDNDEAWKEIMHAVHNAKAKHSKPIKQISLEDILKCKNKDKVKACILQFLEENEGQFALAYLLWCLEKAECVKDVKYMDFHRGMELFLNKQIDAKKPRERYGMLKILEAHADKRDEHKRICKSVNQIEQKWVPVFRSTKE